MTRTLPTTLDSPRGPSALAAARHLATRAVAHIARTLSRQAMNRRVLRQLSAMSERELKDIGLVRQDVADASCGEGDASVLLVARRDERRSVRRAR
ncbi:MULTISPECIES: DUF1127 domain-containing protein [unclassified Methylobacterium]|uniref:DUF1127 domain-containing protein n=1 Tax=unclassified Methylobacterium TaxID=2615210 RepID=UPI0006F557A8|nr:MULTISPECIES: DUF1127 domain-containing protein [unclassified Methylobacterium]KQP61547.1 hypothetical protein ASF39_02395 [Methylobacterium sp. Leaf108]KQT80749.1 hypothetical protein ASG59_04830 [Methylobacterium sp. Leaf466]